MSDPLIQRVDTAEELAEAVAAALLQRLAAAQAAGEVPQIGLTGGTIAEHVHRAIARLSPGSAVDWSRVVVWWGDERFVAPDSPDRNAGQARAAFLDAVGADPAHVHEMPSTAEASGVDEGAAAYSATMRAEGAGSFEVLMLGLGPDGHVASLFPGHPALDVDDRIAVGVTDSPKPPPERISLTFAALNHAKAVWFLVSGQGKADAVARALGGAEVHEIPATGVAGEDETVWFLDEAAASRL
jgi:6-phosphogluconolactonase